MSVLPEVLAANAKYVSEFGDRGSLALPPARRFAILTCMDARLDPAKYAGLAEGEVLNNISALRSSAQLSLVKRFLSLMTSGLISSMLKQ